MIGGETGGGQELPDNPSVYLTLLLLPTHRKLRAKSSNKICFYSQSGEAVFTCVSVHTCEAEAECSESVSVRVISPLLSSFSPRDHPALAHSPL